MCVHVERFQPFDVRQLSPFRVYTFTQMRQFLFVRWKKEKRKLFSISCVIHQCQCARIKVQICLRPTQNEEEEKIRRPQALFILFVSFFSLAPLQKMGGRSLNAYFLALKKK